MFGLTAALAVEATADTGSPPDATPAPQPEAVAPATTAHPVVAAAERLAPIEGDLPPGFTVDDIDPTSIPEGGVFTGELSENGLPVVVVVHPRTGPVPAAAAPAATPTATTGSAAPVVAAPTPLTATPVVTEVVAAPAPAPAPAPVATTSGS